MPALYTTIEGDMIDLIALDYYGSRNGTTEVILEANKGLEWYPPVLPSGVQILLPDLDLPAVRKLPVTRLKLWD